MPKLEILAHADLPTASRDLAAMQALAQRLVETGEDDRRLRPLARALARDLDAALAGKTLPWSEARTRFETRKLERLLPEDRDAEGAIIAEPADAMANSPAPEWDDATSNRTIITRLAIALVAAAVWGLWIAQLNASGTIAWDGGTGPAQTQNLFTLYAPAVLALLATLIAITPPDRIPNAPDR